MIARVAIMIPFYKQLPSSSAKCLIDLCCLLGQKGYGFTFFSIDNTYLHSAREGLYERYEQEEAMRNYDWILHIDSDQTFEVEQVVSLLEHAEEKDFAILSGIYFGRSREQITPILMNKIDEPMRKEIAKAKRCSVKEVLGEYQRMVTLPNEAFFSVDVIGFGFFVCKPKVYKEMVARWKKPVFPLKLNKKNNRIKGEDVVWCERARALGYKLMVDRSIIVGHVGGETSYRDHLAWKAERYLAHEKENDAFEKQKREAV